MKYREPEKLSDSKLKAYHWWLHSKYSREDVSRKEVVRKHVEAVRVMEARGLKHPGRDKLDRETVDNFAREGGKGSGHYGHAGRPGHRGGSAPGTTGGVPRPSEQYIETVLGHVDKDIDKVAKYAGATQEEVIEQCSEFVDDYIKDGDVSIRVPRDVLTKILEDGRFKTQYEVGESRGSFSPKYRLEAEEKGFGPHEDHPVYGYIDNPNYRHGATSYGAVRVVLKDGIKNRTTVTVGDSYGNMAYSRVVPDPIANVGKGAWDESVKDLYRGKMAPYMEAQIHGGVRVKDIGRVVFNKGMARVFPQEFGAMTAALDKRGIGWEEMK